LLSPGPGKGFCDHDDDDDDLGGSIMTMSLLAEKYKLLEEHIIPWSGGWKMVVQFWGKEIQFSHTSRNVRLGDE